MGAQVSVRFVRMDVLFDRFSYFLQLNVVFVSKNRLLLVFCFYREMSQKSTTGSSVEDKQSSQVWVCSMTSFVYYVISSCRVHQVNQSSLIHLVLCQSPVGTVQKEQAPVPRVAKVWKKYTNLALKELGTVTQ